MYRPTMSRLAQPGLAADRVGRKPQPDRGILARNRCAINSRTSPFRVKRERNRGRRVGFGRRRHERVLLQRAFAVAARQQREHERVALRLLPEGHRPQRPHRPGRRADRRGGQQPATQDPRLAAPRRAVRRHGHARLTGPPTGAHTRILVRNGALRACHTARQLFHADTRWDYDHSVHLLRRSLAFPRPRWGHCKRAAATGRPVAGVSCEIDA